VGEAVTTAPAAAGPGGQIRRWAGILTAFFTAQGLVQLAGVAAGLLLVRTLPVREFALYTLALSVVTFFTFLSDLGSTTSLVHFFHRARQEGEPAEPYFEAVLSLRRIAFLVGAAGVVLLFPRAAAREGFGTVETLLVTGGIVLSVWFQIQASLRVLALRLADQYQVSYRAEVAGAGVRLLAVGALILAARLYAWLGILAGVVATATVSFLSRPSKGLPQTADLRPFRRQVLRYLLPTLPSALYFAVQGPLTVWLAATFGAARNIAEVGAVSRLGMIVGLFASLSSVVLLPRLARITDERLWRLRAVQSGGLLLGVALSLLAVAVLFPAPLLWILGQGYAGLDRELALVVAGAGLALMDGYLVSLNLARSWTRWQGLAVVSLVVSQAVLLALLPLDTTAGVLTFNLLSGAAVLLGQLAITAVGFIRPERVLWR
jgi:O-antigen/teichoic acid export membrane protein